MDLSGSDIEISAQIKALTNKGSGDKFGDQRGSTSDLDILDLNGLDLDDEETWLYSPKPIEEPPKKQFDSRTFTRKKKPLRPSLNDIDFISEEAKLTEELEPPVEPHKPLHFDLSQPTSNFDSFVFNQDVDSFQNMSPPSLVNSLCSSTFANLMESSFIKNDPILREISDKDYTMLQDIEMPMFQSITESCSSLNSLSDTPENFLRKVQRDSTFRRRRDEGNTTIVHIKQAENRTFEMPNVTDDKHATFNLNETLTPESEPKVLNGTYKRSPKNNGTFRKSDLKNNRLTLSQENDMNTNNKDSMEDLKSTNTVIMERSDSIEELKKEYSNEGDLNRLSYSKGVKEEEEEEEEEEVVVVNRTMEIKRSSLGSADSLDRMSSLSSSSKGSSKVLSMEDVQAIVEMQERSLGITHHVMSTPKGPIPKMALWDQSFGSPITAQKDALSDSEDYRSAKPNSAPKPPVEKWAKPLVNLDFQKAKLKPCAPKPLQALRPLGGSQQNLARPSGISNLKTMNSKLKGSYTSLRPISANLPVAPPLDVTVTRPSTGETHRAKSGLPRPTGIPRPASRIPGPKSGLRTTNI